MPKCDCFISLNDPVGEKLKEYDDTDENQWQKGKKKAVGGVNNAHFETYGHVISQLCFIPH